MAERYYQYLVLFELPVQPTVHFGMMNWLERKTYSRCFLCLSLVFTSSCFIQRGYSTEINYIPSMTSEENYWLHKYKRQTSTGETAQDKTQTSQKFSLQFRSLVMTQANQLQKNPSESWLMKTIDKISCDGLGNQDQQWESPSQSRAAKRPCEPAVSCSMMTNLGLIFAGVSVLGGQCWQTGNARRQQFWVGSKDIGEGSLLAWPNCERA